MFRKMRRFKQEISKEECLEILINEPRGVLAIMGENDYPYAFPMNHFYKDGKLYFHCAKEGHKIDALHKNNRVSFCVHDQGYIKDNEWALNIKSVVIFGKITTITDKNKIEDITREIGLKHYPTPKSVEDVLQKNLDRINLLELTIDHMSGKLVNES